MLSLPLPGSFASVSDGHARIYPSLLRNPNVTDLALTLHSRNMTSCAPLPKEARGGQDQARYNKLRSTLLTDQHVTERKQIICKRRD